MQPTILITGASKGIGYATAEHFSNLGWRVINIARSLCLLPGVENIILDLSLPATEVGAALQAELNAFIEKNSQLCLVHNAAMHTHDSIAEQDPNELTAALQLSLVSSAVLNQLLIPYMQPGSSIVYMGSTLSEKAVPNTATYSTIKHALVGMMRATCQDLAQQQIHTACICPGFTDTQMLRQHIGNEEQLVQLVKNKVSFARLIAPQEIAALIYYVAMNPVINGSVIHANLGQIES